ncbi:MAG: O-antigen polymerase [Pedosphaera sp.]|nr:O-antigen polymerase [Pedosphaera sp.]
MTRAAPNKKGMSGGPPGAPAKPSSDWLPSVFAGMFGLLLGLTLLKFGNPVVMEKFIERPANIYEWVLNSGWPAVISHWLLAAVVILGLFVARWKTGVPRTLVALPLAWLIWQAIAATHTADARLTELTLIHFASCTACFYLGLFGLSRVQRLWPFWAGITAAFIIVLLVGFQQHFGGLEEARRYFYLYIYPTLKDPPLELLKKMTTTRIFSTLVYPNALAGVILLLLPVILVLIGSMKTQMTIGARRLLIGIVAGASLACLFWSGSKGGWLLMLLLGLIALLFLPFKRQLKLLLIGGVLVMGLAGFFVKYSGFFQRGATSVVARFDYWRAAVQITREKPVFGNGPGAFALAYEKIKKPESEMARLTHNDFLEQACDSGLVGFVLYAALVIGALVYTFRHAPLRQDPLILAVWLGLLGWALQSLFEFGLYIPALSWIAFGFMGWLLGKSSNQIDTRNRTV